MPIREIEEWSYERLILLQKTRLVYQRAEEGPDVVFDRLEANQDGFGEGSITAQADEFIDTLSLAVEHVARLAAKRNARESAL